MSGTLKLNAVFEAKCPRCRRGNMFRSRMYGFKLQRSNEICPNCGFRFEIEPGYYYAAMYISYAMNVAEMIVTAIATFYLSGKNESPWLYLSVILCVILLLAPFNLRYSRVILLHYLSPNIKYNSYYDKS